MIVIGNRLFRKIVLAILLLLQYIIDPVIALNIKVGTRTQNVKIKDGTTYDKIKIILPAGSLNIFAKYGSTILQTKFIFFIK